MCDPGVDDVIALAVLAGAGRPPARVVAVSGNVSSATAARVASGACALLGLDLPVLVATDARAARAASHHGDDGFVGLADQLPLGRSAEPLRALDGDVLVTAPMTVVARFGLAGRALWQGGGFNEEADPTAASVVECEVVPVELAARVHLDVNELEGPDLLIEAVRRYGAVVHDAVAAVAWYRPELFTWEGRRAVDLDVDAVRREIADMVSRCT